MSEISFISMGDFPKICRICLGDENLLFPIFDLIIDNIKGTDLLEYSINLEADRCDNQPTNICEACLKELCRIHKFKQKCHENSTKLKLLIEANSEVVDLTEIEDKESLELSEIKEIPNNKREKTDNSEDVIPCELCNKLFKARHMTKHMKSHTREKRYQCTTCLKNFNLKCNLQRHLVVHTKERPYMCSKCGKAFTQVSSLKTHEKLSRCAPSCGSDTYNFCCEHCGIPFKTVVRYNRHLKSHASNNNTVADSTPEYVCEVCASAFKRKDALDRHLLIHSDNRSPNRFMCDQCGKGFNERYRLVIHMRIHTREKPYKCDVCDKRFSHDGTLRAHSLRHSGVKPYTCRHCPKTFRQPVHLMYHLRTHTGEKPYVCRFCGKAWALKGNLMVHERTHTGEKPYACDVCEKGFYDSSSLKKHKKNHEEEKTKQKLGEEKESSN